MRESSRAWRRWTRCTVDRPSDAATLGGPFFLLRLVCSRRSCADKTVFLIVVAELLMRGRLF